MRHWFVNTRDLLQSFAGWTRIWVCVGCFLTVSIYINDQASGQLPRATPPPDASGQIPGTPEDESQRQMAKKQELRRNEERQKELVRDTDRLLALATDLKSEVDRTSKDVLSVEVVKKAEEIEKLAKSVKDRMRSR